MKKLIIVTLLLTSIAFASHAQGLTGKDASFPSSFGEEYQMPKKADPQRAITYQLLIKFKNGTPENTRISETTQINWREVREGFTESLSQVAGINVEVQMIASDNKLLVTTTSSDLVKPILIEKIKTIKNVETVEALNTEAGH